MGQTSSVPQTPNLSSGASKCPIPHDAPVASSSKSGAAQCPIDHTALAKPKAAQCPIKDGEINPLNQMPDLAQVRQENQTMDLPLERTISSIPRDGEAKWEYPSPQQFYNALVRKGWETPEDEVGPMVDIHNFLNEEAWQEVKKWEKRRTNDDDIQLARFQGKPGQMSPKARMYLFAGWLLPSRFNNEPPFDRHDWVVRRPKTGEEVRYIIDYYSAPPEPDGMPVFSLDVRPALDDFSSVKDRIAFATQYIWKASNHDKQ
ncbi:putative pyruvate carboxylase isoform [Crepidotus variabilis]|uniref:Holocytochrome c-type synthase n=1 Tax=Crepidotus variabilis TaxID=179855 RepID=A0A9P6EKE4_9AGAR|nr:putative pyruvate carboxylase isoform [Crepidotus variabilis]